jgi:release factor glutamine methyltransferase
MYTILARIHDLSQQLAPIYETEQEQEQVAWWLLQKVTNKTQAELIAQEIDTLSGQQKTLLQTWIHEHVFKHKPLQYILGSVPFGSLEILVEPPILIPRPETEEWTLALAHQLQKIQTYLTLLDLCTGTGCIALALAKALPKAQVYATDISKQAIELTKKNAAHNHISNVMCIERDLYQALPKHLRFDLIVGNPPYLSETEWKKLDPMVNQWEDKHALVAEHEGFALLESIIQQAPDWLKKNEELKKNNLPQLMLEIGYQQGKHAVELMKSAGFTHVTVQKDLAGKDRVVMGRID